MRFGVSISQGRTEGKNSGESSRETGGRENPDISTDAEIVKGSLYPDKNAVGEDKREGGRRKNGGRVSRRKSKGVNAAGSTTPVQPGADYGSSEQHDTRIKKMSLLLRKIW